MTKNDFTCWHSLRVRWAEVDSQGVVFNANYLSYFDIGVAEWFRAIGVPYPAGLAEHGMDTFARKAELEFHSPAHYDDSLAIGARAGRLGREAIRRYERVPPEQG